MTAGMGGPHHFDFVIVSDDSAEPRRTVTVKAEFPSS